MSDTPNRLVALVFDDCYKADEARAALRRMVGEGLLQIGETALIEKHPDGRIRVSQDTDTVEGDKRIGHIAGLVTAAVTGIMPLILVGTIGGKLIGKLRDNGITDAFLKDLQEKVQPNTSTLVLFGRSNPEGRKEIVRRLATFKPAVLESDLPPEVEHAMAETLRKAGSGAGGGQ
jgi:uncharacterized membrane protein